MKLKFLIGIISVFVFTNCGFKVVNNTVNFNISEISALGDKKINYNLRNKLLASSNKNNNNLIKLKINSKRDKSIKEKNINNQITKYEIRIDVEVVYEMINGKISERQKFSKNGFYDVGDRQSITLNAEKNITILLINDLADDIIDYLNNINDI
tara:strand:- start:112 stop:573 length:462 start_codon:yes stop_codon:yes gene_type:complete